MSVIWSKCDACDLAFYVVHGSTTDPKLRCPTCLQSTDCRRGLLPVS